MSNVPDFTGVHLWQRVAWGKENLEPVFTDYRIVWEPGDPEAPVAVTVPDQHFMALAMAGGILPANPNYWRLARREGPDDRFVDRPDYFSNYEAAAPMSEEQAIEYLVVKDLPPEVWAERPGQNRPRFVICTVHQIPATRDFRNAWELAA